MSDINTTHILSVYIHYMIRAGTALINERSNMENEEYQIIDGKLVRLNKNGDISEIIGYVKE